MCEYSIMPHLKEFTADNKPIYGYLLLDDKEDEVLDFESIEQIEAILKAINKYLEKIKWWKDFVLDDKEWDEEYPLHLINMKKGFEQLVEENKGNKTTFIVLHELMIYINDLCDELEYFSIKKHGAENVDITVHKLLKYSREASEAYSENIFSVFYEKMLEDD